MDYDDLITYTPVLEYIKRLVSFEDDELGELEKQCREQNFPIVKPETKALLKTLLQIHKPETILEIGACVGFSALLMKENSHGVRKIITIDRYEYMIRRARKNFESLDGEKIIELREGQAIDMLEKIDEQFEMIFLDAAKGQYPVFLPHCLRLLKRGGLFIADNVLFRGITAQQERASRRDKTIARRLDEFINSVVKNEELVSSLIPIGDGVLIAYKK